MNLLPMRSEWLDHLGNWLAPSVGDWVKNEVAVGITWLQLFASLAALFSTVIIVEILRWLTQRKIKKESEVESTVPDHTGHHLSWLKLILQETHPPFVLFVWIFGLYAAFWFLLFQLPPAFSAALLVLDWLERVGLIIALFWLLFRMINVVEMELKHWTARTPGKFDDILAAVAVRALRLVTPLVAAIFILPALPLPSAYHSLLQQAASLFLIGGVGFILYELATTTEKIVLTEYRIDVKDNLAGRKIQTQVRVLKKIAIFLIIFLTVASMLMVFDPVRALGKSLLASAGIAGVVIGFAAQRSLATLVAGIQIAFSQPIRIDDVVIVESEWGRVEEITMTYVVVVLWDLRRMVVPITYFIEKPFQNWTRVSANLIGTVLLYMDYTVPLSALRGEMDRILENSRLWDRKVKVLQVTDAKENTLELRVLASAADSSATWDLRCEIREQLVDFIQRNYPGSLPHRRQMSFPFPNKIESEEKKAAA